MKGILSRTQRVLVLLIALMAIGATRYAEPAEAQGDGVILCVLAGGAVCIEGYIICRGSPLPESACDKFFDACVDVVVELCVG